MEGVPSVQGRKSSSHSHKGAPFGVSYWLMVGAPLWQRGRKETSNKKVLQEGCKSTLAGTKSTRGAFFKEGTKEKELHCLA